jgi:four helix bundle protein
LKLCGKLRIGDQLLRSSMAVRANYEEAQGAESRLDLSIKLQIAPQGVGESISGCAYSR